MEACYSTPQTVNAPNSSLISAEKGSTKQYWYWFDHQSHVAYCSDIPLLTNVTGNKGDHQLLSFAALTARLGNNILVEHLHSALKAGKFHHGVGNLPHPQWHHTLIETGVEEGGGRSTCELTKIASGEDGHIFNYTCTEVRQVCLTRGETWRSTQSLWPLCLAAISVDQCLFFCFTFNHLNAHQCVLSFEIIV